MGCPFDAITVDEAVELVLAWREAPVRATHTLVTVDVPTLMAMRDDTGLTRAIDRADAVVIAGRPLVWTSRWLRSPVPEQVPSAELMHRLLAAGDARGLSVYLLGTTEERLSALQRVIRTTYPRVHVAGARHGFFSVADHAAVVRGIREARADVLLTGMPKPDGEIWCHEHREALETPAVINVGSAFDVLAGFVPRAPRLLQQAGLDWAFRLALEPRTRWRRDLVTNTAFLAQLPRALNELRSRAGHGR